MKGIQTRDLEYSKEEDGDILHGITKKSWIPRNSELEW